MIKIIFCALKQYQSCYFCILYPGVNKSLVQGNHTIQYLSLMVTNIPVQDVSVVSFPEEVYYLQGLI